MSETSIKAALESMRRTMAFDSRDWSLDRRDAWLYGIVVGWNEESLAEFVEEGVWDAETIDRLRSLHEAVAQVAGWKDGEP